MTTKPEQKKNLTTDNPEDSSDVTEDSKTNQKTLPSGSRVRSDSNIKSRSRHKSKRKVSRPRISRTTLAIILVLIPAIAGIITTVLQSETFHTFIQSRKSPLATPVPLARIESLEVIQDGEVIDKVVPSENIFLSTGVTIRFKVNVVTNMPLSDMIVHWEFCHPEKNTHGQGAVEIPYQLGEAEEDCILVKIEKGGQFLDTDRFFVFKK